MARGTSSLAALERAMAETPILASVPRRAVGHLVERGTVRRYRRGTYLFHQGDDAPDIFFLWRGRIEISTISVAGHRQLHTTMESPEFFGELGPLGGSKRTATAEALEDSDLWVVDAEDFFGFLGEQPNAALALLQALAKQVLAHEVIVEDLLFLDLKGRVAKRLLELVSPSLDEPPPDGTMVPSVVTHADLASLAGGSRENVTRILSEFQRRGLVERKGRRYVLKNVTGLRKLAAL